MEKIIIVRNDKGYLGKYISNRLARLLKFRCIIINAWDFFPLDIETWVSINNLKGVILSGSLSSVNDNDRWIAEELKFIRGSIEKKLPILGICFGHQLLGKFFGVGIERKDIKSGLIRIKITKDDNLFDGITNLKMPVSHSDQLTELPQDFELLATSDYCRIQVMKQKCGSIYGIQFHPCYDADAKKIKELGITDMNYGRHEGAKVLYNFLKVCGMH